MQIVVSKATQSLVVPPDNGARNFFPDAPTLPTGNIVVPHDMRSLKLLQHLGCKVPNPMLYYYDWPGTRKPFAIQRATCRLLVENPRAYVLNQMGTGKTRAALWAWDYLNRCGFAKKLLILAPLSTLEFVWAHEVFDTLPHRKCAVLHGSKQTRLDRLAGDADIFIINHDGLRTIESELWARGDVDTLVLDELAVYRNNSDRSKRMRKFANRFAYVWGMTGSPMPHEPVDVWAQCMIVTPWTVPKFMKHCQQDLMLQKATHIWVPKPDAVERAFKLMQPSVRYSLDDVTELPDLITRTVDVPLSDQQNRVYKRVATALQVMVENHQITAVNAAAAMNKLLQIAGGWVYATGHETVRLDASQRIIDLYDLIESANNKVLVAIPYRHMIEGISHVFSMDKIKVDHCVVHGDIHNRNDIFYAFQHTSQYKVMLLHPQCVAHGLTLTAADTTIWYLPITSLEIYEQLNARIRRVGQQHKQQIIHMRATPIERKLYRMLEQHQKMQDSFLKLVAEATGEAI